MSWAHAQIARDGICLIVEQIIENKSGLRKLILQTTEELEDRQNLEPEDRELFFNFLRKEMEDYSSQLDYAWTKSQRLSPQTRMGNSCTVQRFFLAYGCVICLYVDTYLHRL